MNFENTELTAGVTEKSYKNLSQHGTI